MSFDVSRFVATTRGEAATAASYPSEQEAAGAATLVEAMYDSAPVGFACLDCDFRYLRVNEALARMHGTGVDDHIGRTAEEMVPALWSQLEPVYRSVLETGETVLNHRVSGEDSDHPGNWLASVYPVQVDGDTVGLGSLVVDISARTWAEEFRAVVTENMVEGLYAIGADGRATFVNAAASEMLGWSEEELRVRQVHDTIHFQLPDGTPLSEDDCQLRRVRVEGEALHSVDDTYTRRDGSLLPVTYSAAPVTTAEHGRGVVVVFRDATLERAEKLRADRDLATVDWLGRTRDALDEDRLVLYSQPIVPLRGDPATEELLVRMIGRDGEVIPPADFLPVAEEYGLIAEIDRWVIAKAVRIAAQGRRIEVNVSVSSIDAGLLAYIDTELREVGADPGDLIFELTETALMGDGAAAERFARGLAEIGCGLALDDFGTGFASLAYLKILPVQYLKIDVEFVRDLAGNLTNQHLVKAIVSLAHGLGQKTVAEGVADQETLTLLREYGVDFAQGFFLGRPAPVTGLPHRSERIVPPSPPRQPRALAAPETDGSAIADGLEPLRRLQTALTVAALFNAGSVDELVEFVHEDVTVLSVPGVAPGPGFFGRDGLRRYFDDAAAAGFSAQAVLTDARVTEAGNVLAAGKLLSTVDDATLDIPAWFVYRFRDGKVSAIETFLDRDTAWVRARRRS